MRHRKEAVDFGIEHEARLFEIVDEMLAYPRTPHREFLVGNLPQGAPEGIATFGQTRITNEQVRRLATHLLDDIAAHRPQVAHVGYVGLDGKRIDALIAQRIYEIERIDVAAMEVNPYRDGAIQSRR